MRNTVRLSLLASVLVLNVSAADDLASMFKEGKASGQIRAFYVDREYQGTLGNKTHREATAIGGYLKYETGAFSGLSLGTAFYTTNGLFLESPKNDYNQNDMTLLGRNNESYSMLGELYAQYKRGNTTFKGGRQKLDTPMAGSDDARMVPNLFEAYVLSNTDIKDTTLIAAHVTKFAQGTFGRVYNHTETSPVNPASLAASKLLSVTSGYSYVNSLNQVGDFTNMGTYALGQSTNGVSILSATYSGIENVKLQLWDYYAHDIANIVYGEANFNGKAMIDNNVKPSAGIQVIKQNDVGDSYAGELEGLYVAGKVGLKVNNFDLGFAYSQTGKNTATDPKLENAIITPWGGMPAYTQGMVTRHMFLAGTKAYKVNGGYDFKDMGANLTTSVYYTEFDMDANSGYGLERTASEAGFDAIYYPEYVKNLQLRFRGNFPRSFAESATGTTGWSEYRFIANYNF